MKPIFRTDLMMVVFMVVTLFTGVQIHYAGHFQSHEIWHNWSVVHIFAAIALLVTAAMHIKQHWGFFKSIRKNKDISIRGKITMVLILNYVVVLMSGVYLLLFVYRQGSSVGFAHYVMGIGFVLLGLGHFAKRWKIFKKGVVK